MFRTIITAAMVATFATASLAQDIGAGDGDDGTSPRGTVMAYPSYGAGTGQRVVLLGDSYFAGSISDDVLRDNILPEEAPSCWRRACVAAIIEDFFAANASHINVRNVAFGGSNTRDWSPEHFRIDDVHWSQREEPLFDRIPAGNVAVIHLGGNDITGIFETDVHNPAWDIGFISTKEYRRNISTIVDTLTNRGFEHVVILGTLSGPNWREGNMYNPQPNEWWNTLGKRHRKIRSAAQEYVETRNYFQEQGLGGLKGRVHYVDTFHTWAHQNQNGYWDGTGNVHPTINGHWGIAKDVIPVLFDIFGLGEAPAVPFPNVFVQ